MTLILLFLRHPLDSQMAGSGIDLRSMKQEGSFTVAVRFTLAGKAG
ncbi:hypothetical protein K227x_36760 [Rubripirellula lacrimiformis]|uniref:Uncharacterized protein n=1 Tax=Rubripirellula lacrimiformis TaxID=1930273 RepID=A0A517NDS2_9BACT|nr:hypothetical protein [Rubripirellula lacrimiformis]QDT05276.1 hypothetical protein K227x_36760 [Rubripirellula lacrimiformis]